MSEKRYWGPHSEYGPFSTQPDGWPHRGEIMRAWRKKKKFSAKYVAEAYGRAVHGQPVSERWVTMAEKDNLVPKDEQRRRILASLLGIPPILFGFGSLEDLLPLEERAGSQQRVLESKQTLKQAPLNERLTFFDMFLHLYWQLDYTSTAQTSLHDIQRIIADVQALASLVHKKDEQAVYELLCGFYCLASTIYNDMSRPQEAMTYANYAVTLAENMNNNKMRAVACYQRGFVFLQQATPGGELTHMLSLKNAITDFEYALPLAVPRVEAALLLDLAYAQALSKQRRVARSQLDKAEKIISKGRLEDETFVDLFANLNTGRFHLGKASVLLALKELDEAEEELDHADEKISSDQTRRHAWIDILRAKIYLSQGSYPVATVMAINALKTSKSIQSMNMIQLVQGVYHHVSKSLYRHSSEVSHLKALLMLP